ncbi:MAG TPA: hypothetical protein VIJ47_02610 [Acidimicrobiales bacterium]
MGSAWSNVNFGTAADLNSALPGFVTPGFYFVDIVPAGTSPFRPLLRPPSSDH